jgi:hypothetical protein
VENSFEGVAEKPYLPAMDLSTLPREPGASAHPVVYNNKPVIDHLAACP